MPYDKLTEHDRASKAAYAAARTKYSNMSVSQLMIEQVKAQSRYRSCGIPTHEADADVMVIYELLKQMK